MRLINCLLIGLLVTGSATFSSCNKETRIEKNLWEKGGKWTIESLEAKKVSTFLPDNFDVTAFNYGTFTFTKDGTGIYVFTYNGNYDSGIFHYSSTKDKLLMSFYNDDYEFGMNWKKNEVQITRTENFSSSLGSGTYSESYSLKKEK